MAWAGGLARPCSLRLRLFCLRRHHASSAAAGQAGILTSTKSKKRAATAICIHRMACEAIQGYATGLCIETLSSRAMIALSGLGARLDPVPQTGLSQLDP